MPGKRKQDERRLLEELIDQKLEVRVLTEEKMRIFNLITSPHDPAIPALLEAFSKVEGATTWKEPDEVHPLDEQIRIEIERKDGSFISVMGWLRPLSDVYGEAGYNIKGRFPRFDNLELRILAGGSNLIEDYIVTLRRDFAYASRDVQFGREKKLTVFNAPFSAKEPDVIRPREF